MADYLSTNTRRVRVTQTGPRGTHKMVFRVDPAAALPLAIDSIRAACLEMLRLCLAGTIFASAELAAVDSDVFLPITFAIVNPGTVNATADNNDEYGRYVNFVGRSTGGSRVAFYLFNVMRSTASSNNRLTQAEQPIVGTIIGTLSGQDGILCGIDQNPFVLKDYANTGINDKVAKKSRSLV